MQNLLLILITLAAMTLETSHTRFFYEPGAIVCKTEHAARMIAWGLQASQELRTDIWTTLSAEANPHDPKDCSSRHFHGFVIGKVWSGEYVAEKTTSPLLNAQEIVEIFAGQTVRVVIVQAWSPERIAKPYYVIISRPLLGWNI